MSVFFNTVLGSCIQTLSVGSKVLYVVLLCVKKGKFYESYILRFVYMSIYLCYFTIIFSIIFLVC